MKSTKLFLSVVTLIFFIGCSTNTDSNGNSTTGVPVVPSKLIGTIVSSTQINLSWADNSTNETGFKIERKSGTGAFTVVGTTATNITTFSDTALTSGTTYVYRVYSNNAVGNSITYSNELTLTTTIPVSSLCDDTTVPYPSIIIGTQVWMQKNLNVCKYRNGDDIPQVTDPIVWKNLTTGAWCYYANTTSNGTTYGKLYNWYAVNDIRGLAPTGYHIPTDLEWTTLITYLGGVNVAGYKMKTTTLWAAPNADVTNSSGFSGLPGGQRVNDGNFNAIGNVGNWWSSTENTIESVWTRSLANSNGGAGRNSWINKGAGFSVRCLKD